MSQPQLVEPLVDEGGSAVLFEPKLGLRKDLASERFELFCMRINRSTRASFQFLQRHLPTIAPARWPDGRVLSRKPANRNAKATSSPTKKSEVTPNRVSPLAT